MSSIGVYIPCICFPQIQPRWTPRCCFFWLLPLRPFFLCFFEQLVFFRFRLTAWPQVPRNLNYHLTSGAIYPQVPNLGFLQLLGYVIVLCRNLIFSRRTKLPTRRRSFRFVVALAALLARLHLFWCAFRSGQEIQRPPNPPTHPVPRQQKLDGNGAVCIHQHSHRDRAEPKGRPRVAWVRTWMVFVYFGFGCDFICLFWLYCDNLFIFLAFLW